MGCVVLWLVFIWVFAALLGKTSFDFLPIAARGFVALAEAHRIFGFQLKNAY
jgi:hypothetical protein